MFKEILEQMRTSIEHIWDWFVTLTTKRKIDADYRCISYDEI